jgi:hypothetical protein
VLKRHGVVRADRVGNAVGGRTADHRPDLSGGHPAGPTGAT